MQDRNIPVNWKKVLKLYGNEEQAIQMLQLFLDTFLGPEAFMNIHEFYSKGNWEELFRAVHTLKGNSGYQTDFNSNLT
jgi:hypothetical protein